MALKKTEMESIILNEMTKTQKEKEKMYPSYEKPSL